MTLKTIFETMDYGKSPENDQAAQAWLDENNSRSFGHFIDGVFTKPTKDFSSQNPATGATLASLSQAQERDVKKAVNAARKAQPDWAKDGTTRARYLYALARAMQKHARLFAVLETLDNGKPIRESRDIDIPLAQRHFYYHAGFAQLMSQEFPDRQPIGVCGQIIPWNFPLLMLAWKIAPALAMGNTVVLKPAEYTSLSALLFAQICQQIGLPKGVVNIVTGDGRVGEMLINADVDKLAFTGSTAIARRIRQATAGSGKALSLELGGKSPYIVFDDADLDSAVEGLVDAIWFNQGQVCCAGSRLLVQEAIAPRFYDKLKTRMNRLRIGDPLDKSIDIGAIVDPVQLERISHMVSAHSDGAELFQTGQLPAKGCYYPPTLITGLSPSDPLMQEEIFGPVLVSTTFRTPAEAVGLANNTRYGLAASVWSENINLALDMAAKLVAGVVWINATNMLDAAAGFGGLRESGYGREGGWEGLSAYTKPAKPQEAPTPVHTFAGTLGAPAAEGIDRTAKLYIGGKQVRPDGGYSRMIYGPGGAGLGEISLSNRKDVRNAVEATKAAAAWGQSSGHLRAQILYYMAENLSARSDEFARRIKEMTGTSGTKEVERAIQTLFTCAAWADKYDGRIHGVPIRGVAIALHEPAGVIGAICPAQRPLSGLIDVIAPAFAMGNRIVALASAAFPLSATDFIQILETSDVPGGTINLLTGDPDQVAPTLAAHTGVDALWSFGASGIAKDIEEHSISNLKRTLIRDDVPDVKEMLEHATEVKNIWIPYGE